MVNPIERYLKLGCLVLGTLLMYQVFQFVSAPDPIASPTMLASSGNPAGSTTETGPPPSAEIPLPVRERIERITQREILGPVPRPPPMALLGIGGDDIFLRTDTGQTGLMREGDELGNVKLIEIGTNRILIEHEGQLKELTIFSGLGGDSLLPE